MTFCRCEGTCSHFQDTGYCAGRRWSSSAGKLLHFGPAHHFSGYWLMMPGSFKGPDFIFTYGAGLIFIFLYVVFKGHEVMIQKKPFRLGVSAEEMDLHSDLEKIEALTAASDAQRASHTKSIGQKISDFIF